MYIVAGLGNPGIKYVGTRHNVGYDCADVFARMHGATFTKEQFTAACATAHIAGEKIMLLKPLTFMNLSGRSIVQAMQYFKLTPDRLIVCYDDIDLPVGSIRVRMKGSAGGHNGIKSIIAALGTQDFPRVKIGVGAKPPGGDLIAHVLGRFPVEEGAAVDDAVERAADAVTALITNGPAWTMNRYNA
ncbi:MAG: aminoacyl-tRNA hydrolase [Eubacteriales bacterium]|nr:aminoacyl-tRNA hydrolase [Eubacteriales bacterium]